MNKVKSILKGNFLQGYKTYIVVVIGIVYAITGVLSHNLSIQQAMDTIFPLLSAAGIRKAL